MKCTRLSVRNKLKTILVCSSVSIMNYDDEDDDSYDPYNALPKPTFSGVIGDDTAHVNKKPRIQENYAPIQNISNTYAYNTGNMMMNGYPYPPVYQQPQGVYMATNNQWDNRYPMTWQQYMPAQSNSISMHTPDINYTNYHTPQPVAPYISENSRGFLERQDPDKTSTSNSIVKSEDLVRGKNTSEIPDKHKPVKLANNKDRDKTGNKDDDDDELSIPKSEEGAKVLIPGTSISLETEEDIKKWKDERRKMWLLRISNNKKEHMEKMGYKDEDLKKETNVLKESRKDKNFIKNIQSQISRANPNVNLNTRLVQRGMAEENAKLLDFIVELGECGFLEYELTEEEKEKLFGGYSNNFSNNRKNYHGRRNNNNSNEKREYNGVSRYNNGKNSTVVQDVSGKQENN